MKKKKISRRKFLTILGVTGGVLVAGGVGGAAYIRSRFTPDTTPGPGEDGEIVTVAEGQLQGTINDGIYRYLGVPYAEAAERFVTAGPVTPWEGVLKADSYGPMSPQGSMLGFGAGNQDGTDNNCQSLNIWTPGLNDGGLRPVLVWLHGGGFSTGTANDSSYDGEALAKNGDVVVVSVNHRLNVFGYLDLSAYDEKYKDSANVGMWDIIAALEWIQQNIEVFGGDPDNVTVFGQSGGGAKVLGLMSTPYAVGLFHKGIVESGVTETVGVNFTSQEASTRLAENLLAELNIAPENIEQLQIVAVDKLQSAATKALDATAQEFQIPAPLTDGYQMEWEPVVDGDFLPTSPVTETNFADAGQDIPLLIGSNLNEWTGFYRTSTDGVDTDALSAALKTAYPDKTDLTADHVDTLIRLPILKTMSHKADQNGAPVYAYLLTYGSSNHGAEIPYIFRHSDVSAMNDLFSSIWVNFARSGVPSADSLPTWEPYTREGGATMLLDTTSQLVYHHDAALLKLLAPDYEY